MDCSEVNPTHFCITFGYSLITITFSRVLDLHLLPLNILSLSVTICKPHLRMSLWLNKRWNCVVKAASTHSWLSLRITITIGWNAWLNSVKSCCRTQTESLQGFLNLASHQHLHYLRSKAAKRCNRLSQLIMMEKDRIARNRHGGIVFYFLPSHWMGAIRPAACLQSLFMSTTIEVNSNKDQERPKMGCQLIITSLTRCTLWV